ncbi:homoserine dehydrogenase [Clostridium sp. 'White wine YQ']|uniref:homoserine dehydrogenase n=1 Tax=Clostridium sp. 'White wine YQ' TaxID=3027474 RepID=UPI002365A241|nr:homoserine dehydrogenase [Clostridium sp. 'White wine YQ']MDD7795831.1 homoserine dehydrogenase [Clostridium sp. 'White wine YQ']
MVRISLLGYGVVGTGLIELLENNKDKLENIEVVSILVRSFEKHKNKKFSEILTTDIEEFFSKDTDIVVEVMGGINPAYDFVKRALSLGRNVVTANKDLIAEYGGKLIDLARKKGVNLKFEASVGGGIPLLKPLLESLEGNEIKSITGILNGTTNFILTKMSRENLCYSKALREAQKQGFAEANPESDVLGYDAARKLAILSTLAYKKKISWKDINTKGITNLERQDFIYAKELGYQIKLIAVSRKVKDEVYASVEPALIDGDSLFSQINYEVNGVIFHGDAVGDVSFIGKGAGMLPTASAVYSDILDIIKGRGELPTKYVEEVIIKETIYDKSSLLIRMNTNDKRSAIKAVRDKFSKAQLVGEKKDEIAFYLEIESEIEIIKLLNALIKEGKINSYSRLPKVS